MKKKSILLTYINIFIIIGIIGAIIYAGIRILYNEYDRVAYETVKTDLLLIQSQTELISQQIEMDEDDIEYVGTKIDEMADEEKVKELIEKEIIDIESSKSNYYCIDKEDLEELGLSEIKTDSYFIVDYKQNDVIYIDGIENEEGIILYKLSDMETEEVEEDEADTNSDTESEEEE